MGLVIALIVLILLVGLLLWFVVNRATTGKGGEHGGSTPEISSSQNEGEGANEAPASGPAATPPSAAHTGRPVVGGEGEGERNV